MCGVCWKKLELSIKKIPTLISKNYARAGREFLFPTPPFLSRPALAFAATIFRASFAGTPAF